MPSSVVSRYAISGFNNAVDFSYPDYSAYCDDARDTGYLVSSIFMRYAECAAVRVDRIDLVVTDSDVEVHEYVEHAFYTRESFDASR